MVRPDLRSALGTGTFAHRMGLSSAEPGAWFAARAEPERVAIRRACFAAYPTRIGVAVHGGALADVVGFLRAHGATGARFEECASTLASDLLVVGRDPQSLVAIAVALPSGWSPERALGSTVSSIHAIVPGLDESLGASVAAFLGRLDRGRAFARVNVGLAAGAALDRHPDSRPEPLTSDTATSEIFVRVEEQLFVGLESHVLFAVHLATIPIASLDAAETKTLASWLASMPPEVAVYKGIEPIRSDLVERLRAHR